MNRTYLDYNATAPLRPEARAAMLEALAVTGNASSVHAEGRAAHRLLEQARERIAVRVTAAPSDVVFTSSATEAANTLLTPDFQRPGNTAPVARLLVGATEHVAVLNGHRFPMDRVERIGVDAAGRIDQAALCARVEQLTLENGPASVMVAVQAANNETGVIQPVTALASDLRSRGAIVICDAAQYAGRVPLDGTLGANAIILSSHKLGGPQGAGAIVFDGDAFRPAPLLRGGGQERGRRGGTENIAAIAGFAAAAEAAFAEAAGGTARIGTLRDRLERFLREHHPALVVFGEGAERLPNTTCFAIPRISAETLLIALDLAGVAVSSGSACSSGKVAPSHVLAAMGVPQDLAKCALRVSLGWESAEKDLDSFARAWATVLSRIVPEATAAA
jgi:cysteine desulfurase